MRDQNELGNLQSRQDKKAVRDYTWFQCGGGGVFERVLAEGPDLSAWPDQTAAHDYRELRENGFSEKDPGWMQRCIVRQDCRA